MYHCDIEYQLSRDDLLSAVTFFNITVKADSCLSKSSSMMLSQNARDQGSIPHWSKELFCPLQPKVTFCAQIWDSSTCCLVGSMRTCFPEKEGECHSGQLAWWSSSTILTQNVKDVKYPIGA